MICRWTYLTVSCVGLTGFLEANPPPSLNGAGGQLPAELESRSFFDSAGLVSCSPPQQSSTAKSLLPPELRPPAECSSFDIEHSPGPLSLSFPVSRYIILICSIDLEISTERCREMKEGCGGAPAGFETAPTSMNLDGPLVKPPP